MESLDYSILNTIKEDLDIPSEITDFDNRLVGYINTTIFMLRQLGVVSKFYEIQDSSNTWREYIGTEHLNFRSVRTFIFLKVKEMFDPPTISTVSEANKRVRDELEWRLYTEAEYGKKI